VDRRGAFIGALGATLLVFGLAHGDGSWTQTRLLLTGVIVAAGCGAAVALMLSLAPEGRVKGMLFWLMGDASGATRPWPALALLAVGLAAALPFARELNLLARGESPPAPSACGSGACAAWSMAWAPCSPRWPSPPSARWASSG
jgi:ABC-type Fe3+-siderophore transport system permease subunit